MKIKQIDYHRNGVCGEGFYAVLFTEDKELFVASVFEKVGHVSVFSVPRLTKYGVAFGLNSWRGDYFEDRLREAINKHSMAEFGCEAFK